MWHRKISLFMVSIFASLMFASLFANSADVDNCDVFGHIHRYQAKSPQKSQLQSKSSSPAGMSDDECHAGKMISVFSFLPKARLAFRPPSLPQAFKIVPVLRDDSPHPLLEPFRRPPRNS
jgi:hypothetical protein